MTAMAPETTTAQIDLTGGLDPSADLMEPNYPKDDPLYRESVSMWLFDDAGAIQFPRFLIEDVPGEPSRRLVFYNIAFPDGRAVVEWGDAPAVSMLDDHGRPTVYGVEGMAFRCVEPFRTWTASLRGEMTDTTCADLLQGPPAGRRVRVEFDVETTSVVPPWVMGRFSGDTARVIATGAQDSLFMGRGFRYEQLVLARGRCRIGGETYRFSGRGLRVHRRSSRNGAGFRGHVWQTAVFPSGKAFGLLAFPPAPGGGPHVSEAFYFDGRTMHAAEIDSLHWLTEARPGPQEVGLRLRTATRELLIDAEVYATNFSTARMAAHSPASDPMLQQQGCARYRLDGEEAFGMIERSNFRSKIAFGAT
jgi:hypothetical protein